MVTYKNVSPSKEKSYNSLLPIKRSDKPGHLPTIHFTFDQNEARHIDFLFENHHAIQPLKSDKKPLQAAAHRILCIGIRTCLEQMEELNIDTKKIISEFVEELEARLEKEAQAQTCKACGKAQKDAFCSTCGETTADTDHSPEVGKKGEGIETLAERNRREDYLTDEEFDQVFQPTKPTE